MRPLSLPGRLGVPVALALLAMMLVAAVCACALPNTGVGDSEPSHVEFSHGGSGHGVGLASEAPGFAGDAPSGSTVLQSAPCHPVPHCASSVSGAARVTLSPNLARGLSFVELATMVALATVLAVWSTACRCLTSVVPWVTVGGGRELLHQIAILRI